MAYSDPSKRWNPIPNQMDNSYLYQGFADLGSATALPQTSVNDLYNQAKSNPLNTPIYEQAYGNAVTERVQAETNLFNTQIDALGRQEARADRALEASSATETMKQWINIGTTLWSAYTGWQQLQEAKKQNAFQREMATKNFNMVAQDYDRDTKRRAGIARQMGGLDGAGEKRYIEENKAPRIKG